ncbi:MAG: hypothetical protein WC523_06720 [Patescibacteria group bacterium]|jgi:hypothetical protein
MEKENVDPLDVEVRQRLEKFIKNRVLTNEKLTSILNSLGKKEEKANNRLKKAQNKNGQNAPAREYHLKNITGISYAQSLQVWGEWNQKEKDLPVTASLSANPVFNDPKFNFMKVLLRGLSVAAMAERFPENDWGRYKDFSNGNIPGHYLVSYDNPLKNLSAAIEKELHPKDCSRLDFNLTVELLLTISKFGGRVPELFFRTTTANGHTEEVCVGLIKGKITFVSEKKARELKKMGICLVKDENWAMAWP